MGIRGLMSFVEDHSNEFFTDLKLRDTKIVIDGYALFHRLSFNSNLELRWKTCSNQMPTEYLSPSGKSSMGFF
uniref:Asteroid homolog 1 n=2 Tax=Cercopithecidae TaxID=9527 RepID=A0A2K5YLZ7_MANLE